MAISKNIGGTSLDQHTMLTSLDIETLMSLTISGMAFEKEALNTDAFDHLEDRVKALLPARKLIQRQFYNPGVKYKIVRNPETGVKEKTTIDSWAPSAKLKNAKGDLRRWIETSYIDAWSEGAAAMPPFMLYIPELLESTSIEGFEGGQSGEVMLYDFTNVRKAMIADGESRHHAIEIVLSGSSKSPISGSRREKLKSKIVPVVFFHGIEPTAMAQVFADLNGKGVVLSKVETVSRDMKDPWVKATWRIFEAINVDLETRGRQVTAASRQANKHLMLNQAIQMVRALGIGSVGGATSTREMTDDIDFDRVVKFGTAWFKEVVDYFGEGASIFSDPTKVVRSVPIKVALGIMGNAFYSHDFELQHQHRASLSTINWNISESWNGIAGKVSVDKEGNPKLASSGAKEIGNKAKTALCSPETVPGRAVRP